MIHKEMLEAIYEGPVSHILLKNMLGYRLSEITFAGFDLMIGGLITYNVESREFVFVGWQNG